jgi:hypothetical protein
LADKPWKRIEREKCRELGGDRAGPTGRDTPDCTGLRVGLEIKYVKKFTFLKTYWEQATENAEKAGLPPVLAVKEAKRGGRDCVQIRRDNWASLLDMHGSSASAYYTSQMREETLRIPWTTFSHVYRGAYNINNEEN